MRLSAFDYPLNHDRIAQHPLSERDQSKLLVFHRKTGKIKHRIFSDLIDFLEPTDVLVINSSRVWPARISATKIPAGGRVEILLVRPLPGKVWEALIRGKVKPGQALRICDGLQAQVDAVSSQGCVRLRGMKVDAVRAMSRRFGRTPLPPYIHRDNGIYEVQDRQRYQTVYAEKEGSIAAPTAGLHFTKRLLRRIQEKGVKILPVTLHIGPGTFLPVRSEEISDHQMEPEYFEVSRGSIQSLWEAKQSGHRIVAVGTSSVRVLESLDWKEANPASQRGWTRLFIFPGFKFKIVDVLITNLHLPRSTLLMLVAAFAGLEPLLEIYRAALDQGYRFASYGDAMLIL
jgi:S-adenosylmethionine:tRNA ribosyltransferase-isomerase